MALPDPGLLLQQFARVDQVKKDIPMTYIRRIGQALLGVALYVYALAGFTATAATAAASLTPTPEQVEGPYFLDNSPLRNNLVPPGATGQRIQIEGLVLDTQGTVVPNATIHVWLADPRGVYDNQDVNGDPLAIPAAKQKLRGRINADANGKYSFEALRPGNYEVAPGRMRPAHIHIRIEATGYRTLVTQLYFPDDRWNAHDLPGPKFFKPELIVTLQPATPSVNTPQSGKFNFVLQK